MFFFFSFWEKKREYAWLKIRNLIMKIRKELWNLQQGHIIMQWPSQAHLHRWVELVSLDHKSTHGCFEAVTDIIQQDGWISGSQVTFTNLSDRKNNHPLILELLLCSLWPVDYLCCKAALRKSKPQSWRTCHRVALNEPCRLKGALGGHKSDFLDLSAAESFTKLDLCFNVLINNQGY